MKIFSMLERLLASASDPALREEDELRWRRDPLSHPAIEAMSPRELGDLPMPRTARPADACDCA